MTRYDNFLGRVFSGRYTLVSIIGVGECSVVFGAYDRENGKTVALKMLAPDRLSDGEAVKRFLKEVDVLSLFDHPNIVKILDVSLEGDDKFFVMEYIEGITLKKHILTKGALSEEEILFLSRPILSALGEVHKKGIVHSDIKPQNIVLVGSGAIKLMDFGIAKILSQQTEEVSSVTVGTVQYVSPEQAEGRPLDPTSDLYSFGVTLYEMATGVLPFVDDDPRRIAAMQVSSEPIPPSMVCDGVCPALDEVILGALAKTPEKRPQSATELMEALENLHTPKPKKVEDEPKSFKTLWKKLHKRTCFAAILCALLSSVIVSLSILSAMLTDQRNNHTFVRVPNLVGESYLSTSTFGLDEELYKISVEYVSYPTQSGKVIAQSPAQDRLVRQNGKPLDIHLTVARRPLPNPLPDLAYLSEEDARAYLAGYDCRVKTITATHVYLPEGYVLRAEQTDTKEITLYITKK